MPSTFQTWLRGLLIDDVQQAPRMATVRLAALMTIVSTLLGLAEQLQAQVPFLQPLMPQLPWPWITAGFGVVIAVARVVKQNLQPPAADQQQQGI